MTPKEYFSTTRQDAGDEPLQKKSRLQFLCRLKRILYKTAAAVFQRTISIADRREAL